MGPVGAPLTFVGLAFTLGGLLMLVSFLVH